MLIGFLTQLGSAFILNHTFSFGGIWPINLSIGVNQIIVICFEKEKDMIHNNWHISAKYPQSIDSHMK